MPAVNVVDLYSGRPLHCRLLDDGFLLYSVGRNGIDDEGRRERDDPSQEFDDIPLRVVRVRPAP